MSSSLQYIYHGNGELVASWRCLKTKRRANFLLRCDKTMSKTKNLQKKSKLKAGIDEFVGPLLKQLREATYHEDCSSMRDYIDEARLMLEKTKDIIESRKIWDNEIIGCFEKIERQIDYWKENKKEETKHINDREEMLKEFKNLLKNPGAILSMVSSKSCEETCGVDEVSNSSNQEDDNSIQFEEYVGQLDQQHKDCIYILGIFPENEKLKKRLLLYLWIGLRLVPFGSSVDTPAEQDAETFFTNMVKHGILQPVHTRRHNQAVNWCIINPRIHKQLIFTCKSEGLFTDMNCEECTLRFYHGNKGSNVTTLLNLDQKYLHSKDITKLLRDNYTMQVLQFGNWHCIELEDHNLVAETKFKDHIEVDEIEFLKSLGEKVTYLCLRGISQIERLPESIGKLEDLRILDLKACHNLEQLPQKRLSKSHKILRLLLRQQQQNWFKNLTYLDISECYLLDHVPRWICDLSNLKVLKGFVAGNLGNTKKSCQLHDLSKLKKLKKLSIRISKNLDLKELSSLRSLDNLIVLTVIWDIKEPYEGSDGKKLVEVATQSKEIFKEGSNISGFGGEQHRMTATENQSRKNVQGILKASGEGEIDGENNARGKSQIVYFPKNLEKLDIRCYPKDEAPELLNPQQLENVKRLYIRGGKLAKIENKHGWKVEILRLRYLKYLEINWYQLSSIFTKLKCVEYEHCIKLVFFPKKLSCWRAEIDGPFPSASDEPPNVLLRIIRNNEAPLTENNQKMMLELTGWDSMSHRCGLDLVVVLDIRERGDDKLSLLKKAIIFMIRKFGSTDRLSIVTLPTDAIMRMPLNWMSDDYKRELEYVVKNLKAAGPTNIFDGLQMGLNIIKDQNISSRRVSSIMLVSDDGGHNRSHSAVDIPFGNVAVHTFGIERDATVLKNIANNSIGGTFSHRTFWDLHEGLAVCLAGLLTVAVQDLTLTISPIQNESMVKQVSVGRYLQSKDDIDGSVTIKLGELYSSEVRKVLVDLLLPTTYKKGPATVLKISYSYKFLDELRQHNPANVVVSRMPEMPADQQQVQPEIIAEQTRQKIVERVNEAVANADDHLAGVPVQREVNVGCAMDVRNILRDVIKEHPELEAPPFGEMFYLLWKEVSELMEWFTWEFWVGRDPAYGWLSSHHRQRSSLNVTTYPSTYKPLLFATPTMLKFVSQASLFESGPHSTPPTSIDEDVAKID